MAKKLGFKIVIIFSLLTFFVSYFPLLQVVNADQCNVPGKKVFSTSYDNTFSFTDNGQANAVQRVSLTNLKDKCYAQVYTLTIGSEKISNVSGSDGLGAMSVEVNHTQTGQTSLMATLNQQVVGVNKTVTFQINYTIDGLAVKRGRIWDVNIPQIETGGDLASYKLTLSVPKSFGKLGKVSPTPDSTNDVGNNYVSTFGQSSLSNPGIAASYGGYQEFKFTLKYRYKNSNFFNANAEIALPPDTEYQALYYQSLNPSPVDIKTDESGNYIATYQVSAGKTLEVTAKGIVKIIDANDALQEPIDWSSTDLTKFTKSDKYIESDNPEIQKKARELNTIQDIYNYVEGTLKYDYSRLESNSLGRRGALEALKKPDNSICTDYSDLFVALARAKGIPARGLVGYAYTDNTSLRPTKVEGLVNSTVLHAWPEYYDKNQKRWIQVDPTWGSTTGGVDYFNRLDTNHFVFVINGTSSELPLPAGAYKLSANQTDDVNVSFSNEAINIDPKVDLSLSLNRVIAGFPAETKILIANETGRALFNAKLTVKSGTKLTILNSQATNLGIILPFSKQTVALRLRSNSLLDNEKPMLTVNLDSINGKIPYNVSVKKQILVKPFFSLETPQIILIILIIIVLLGWFYPVFHHRFLEKSNIRPSNPEV